jgi:hypothetical protein
VSWYDDKSDVVLYDYLPFLKELSEVDDVRPFLMASVNDNIFDVNKGLLLLKTYKEQLSTNLMKSSHVSLTS